jgi:hypothetical protein
MTSVASFIRTLTIPLESSDFDVGLVNSLLLSIINLTSLTIHQWLDLPHAAEVFLGFPKLEYLGNIYYAPQQDLTWTYFYSSDLRSSSIFASNLVTPISALPLQHLKLGAHDARNALTSMAIAHPLFPSLTRLEVRTKKNLKI